MSSRRCVCHGVCVRVCVCLCVCQCVCVCVCQCVFVYRGRHATIILGRQQLTVDFLQSLFLCMCVLCVTHCVCVSLSISCSRCLCMCVLCVTHCVCVSNWLCLCPCFHAIASGVACVWVFLLVLSLIFLSKTRLNDGVAKREQGLEGPERHRPS
jgi:hypothetical protein